MKRTLEVGALLFIVLSFALIIWAALFYSDKKKEFIIQKGCVETELYYINRSGVLKPVYDCGNVLKSSKI